MVMRVSKEGLAALAVHEGIVPFPYLDSVGVWTVGIGHTASAGKPDPFLMEKGKELSMTDVALIFRTDIKKFEDRVLKAVKVPLKQHEFDALVSFDFNTGGIHRAKLVETLNNGNREAAGAQFMNWLRPPEIEGRRREEMQLFLNGVYPKGKIPVWRADDRGKLRGIDRHIEQEAFVRFLDRLSSHIGTVI